MIGALLKGLIGFFSSGIGHKIGTVLTDGGAVVALVPVVMWLITHKDEAFTCVTYGQLAVIGLIVAAIIKVAHATRAGSASDRQEYH